MAAIQTATQLTEFERRGAGTDAERRAAEWLAGEARSARRDAHLATFWCRPNWALAHAWHSLLAVAGSLLAVSDPLPGGILVLVALLSTVLDGVAGVSLGRRLTPERASQNVVSAAPDATAARPGQPPVRLIVTANYDAGRTGLAFRDLLRAPAARLRRLAAGGALTPGWLGWTVLAMVVLVAVAVLRHTGAKGTPVGVLQLVPTAALVVELALLLELAGGQFGPAAGDNASGTALALALVRALDAGPPANLAVELLLQGAGDGSMTGLRRHLRARRRELKPTRTVVLGIGPCGAGRPSWWVSDGSLLPLRYLGSLRALAGRAADALTPAGETGGQPAAAAHRGRGLSPAYPARTRGLAALTLGCVDARGLAPRSHQLGDVAGELDSHAMDGLLEFALMLVDALDADLSSRDGSSGAGPGRRAA